jgi:hypothetical protein
LFQAKFDKSPRRIAKLQEIPNVSLDATTAGAKTKPAAVGESRNKYSWAGIVLVRVELPVRSAAGGQMYAPIATALRIGLAFALTALLFLTGIYALFGGSAALAAYSLMQFGHLLIILA